MLILFVWQFGSFRKLALILSIIPFALIAALSGYTMVKYFGVIFLGQPREVIDLVKKVLAD